jgi:deazaflavin-dependent oxidoreductase (nitroreductase family)
VTTSTANSGANRPGGAFFGLTKLFNRLTMLLAGTRWLPLYGVIEHRGRRSGKVFRTPVVVRPMHDGFIVPMPWGEGTDWYRNVRAAGGCAIQWKGRTYQLTSPEAIDAASVANAFSGFQRMMMGRLGVQRVLRLRFS